MRVFLYSRCSSEKCAETSKKLDVFLFFKGILYMNKNRKPYIVTNAAGVEYLLPTSRRHSAP